MARKVTFEALQAALDDVLDGIHRERDRTVVARNGKPIAAIVSMEDLEIIEALEDAADAQAADAAKREGGEVTLAAFLKQLQQGEDEG